MRKDDRTGWSRVKGLMQFLPPATILIAVATRIYGFVSFGYASMPWQSILYGTFCVSRICHSRRVARFGHQHRHNLLEEKSRRSRLSKKRVFRNFEKTRSKKKIFQLKIGRILNFSKIFVSLASERKSFQILCQLVSRFS